MGISTFCRKLKCSNFAFTCHLASFLKVYFFKEKRKRSAFEFKKILFPADKLMFNWAVDPDPHGSAFILPPESWIRFRIQYADPNSDAGEKNLWKKTEQMQGN